MHFIRVTTPDHENYQDAMNLYKLSFPEHEQREEKSQTEVLNWTEYHFDLIFDGDLLAGILLYWETNDFLYVEHFCIDPKLRRRRYGERALSLLGEKGKTVILEIDPPVDEVSKRRQGFYERCGYMINTFSHIHPPYHKGYDGHVLAVMSCPGILTAKEYDRFSMYLKNTVMRDVYLENKE